ncbi:His-Xaa-Ser system radical SAM maturase HxsB [Uliginosibacterium sp. TH139]|uniref:His-Xaa-Ser system radical SAM maturase HxsB n=1 Tax=Uliginosibacterium sp. TH139 TaxID=2067453 RepID=UPI000C7D81CF|nr:His-Xaa-Ser system radical SAM maturase HxsB [Uliginosibacterium sp. TH139]PLK48308.1 His-Xaa-Ser system radical SAM maturase HxsB [Uliginosibacterium sp. TH139]
MSKFEPIEFFSKQSSALPSYSLLPFNFTELDATRYVVTNLAGEFILLERGLLHRLVEGGLSPTEPIYADLRARHFLSDSHSKMAPDLLAIKVRTRNEHLANWTGLHMFVLTQRCDHSCPYCQVSRQSEDKTAFDMSREHAEKAVALTLRSPNPAIKIEFQGGESFLNFDLLKHVVLTAKAANEQLAHPKDLKFIVATNLSVATDEMLDFCAQHEIGISTSLDGPRDLHNKNRPRPGDDSYERTIEGIARVRQRLGRHSVSALMTTTEASLSRGREIVDEYVEQGFGGIFLRPLSPYGFAVKTRFFRAYNAEQWLNFYDDALDYVIELNRQGLEFREYYAATILTKMLTCKDPGYVDLRSPAGIGMAGVIYNHDGTVYASDESRMLAEMQDTTFKLGCVDDSFETLYTNETFLQAVDETFAYSAPMCTDCAFEPWCGADPVFHWRQQQDMVGRKPESEFCQRNMHIFRGLISRMENDPYVRRLFTQWAHTC